MKKYILTICVTLFSSLTLAAFGVSADTNGRAEVVKKIIAKQLQKDVKLINPDLTFYSLGADELDIVEIVMAIEEKLSIQINDDELNNITKTNDVILLPQNLKISQFIKVVEGSPQVERKTVDKAKRNKSILYDGEVGSYKELNAKKNPNNLVLVYIPSVEDIIMFESQRLNRKLTYQEIEYIKNNSVTIAMDADNAEKFLSTRKDKSGI